MTCSTGLMVNAAGHRVSVIGCSKAESSPACVKSKNSIFNLTIYGLVSTKDTALVLDKAR